MSNNEHPIIPPPELVQQWRDDWVDQSDRSGLWVGEYIATKAAQWGADQELEACCEWLEQDWEDMWISTKLRAARRPQPPSLKEQALAKLEAMERLWESAGNSPSDLVRRALEALPDD